MQGWGDMIFGVSLGAPVSASNWVWGGILSGIFGGMVGGMPLAIAAEDPISVTVPTVQRVSFATPSYRSGKLRVSNRSEHPIRLALRLRAEKAQGDKYNDKLAVLPKYDAPAHWDFYAGEGSQRGLVVALPNRSVYLRKGDVIVAFAQDGSQRYWGPFVVGETDNPVWNDRTGEWQLILEE